jgi:proteasome lid subunit RPN8/RPN11
MTSRTRLELTDTAFAAITVHALETYPEECCGVILSGRDHDEARPLVNIQNTLHEKDPETFPRDARTAYTMDYQVLDALMAEANRGGLRVKAFYHSHPDHEAYFSEEDKAFATPFGEPTYPDTAQVVISVAQGSVGKVGVYIWDTVTEDFVEIDMVRVPDR